MSQPSTIVAGTSTEQRSDWFPGGNGHGAAELILDCRLRVEAESAEYRGGDIVRTDRIVFREGTAGVGGAVDLPAPDPTASYQDCVTRRPVIAAGILVHVSVPPVVAGPVQQ